MTKEEIRIAIAESLGWKACRSSKNTFNESILLGYAPDNPFPHDKGELRVPDYCNDLNAMHEVEAAIDPALRVQYQDCLDKVCSDNKDPACSCWDIIHATAAQRAEAYLRAKWL